MYYPHFFTAVVALAALNVSTTQRVGGRSNNVSFNNYFSLQAGDFDDITWTMFVYYISFTDDLFGQSEPLFEITISNLSGVETSCICGKDNKIMDQMRMYKNVLSFGIHIDRMGYYAVKVNPLNASTNQNSTGPVQDISITQRLLIRIDNDEQCNLVGQFQFNDEGPNSHFVPLIRTIDVINWTKVTLLKHSCNTWIGSKPKWTFEKIYQRFFVGDAASCLNPRNIRLVNLADYTSQLVPMYLPAPSSESGFIIQPYTLPPGGYRLCNTVSNNTYSVKRCAIIAVHANESSCQTSTKIIIIDIFPEPEEFTWPLSDLTLIVTQHYSLYGIYDAGNTEILSYRFTWICSGDVLCLSLAQDEKVQNSGGQSFNNIEIPNRGTRFYIPADYMTPGTSITVRFKLEYHHNFHELFVCREFVERKISFVQSMYSHAVIRCYVNCWYSLNTDIPLFVGVECERCSVQPSLNPKITWSTSGLPKNTKMFGQNTPYLALTDFGSPSFDTFFVRVTVSFTNLDGLEEEFTLGKRFSVRKTFSPAVVLVEHDFTESQEDYQMNVTGVQAMFPRYSMSLDTLLHVAQHVLGSPVVTTMAVVPDGGNAGPRNSIQTAKPEDYCTTTCGDKRKPLMDGNYPHCTDCSKFITCSFGRLEEKVCPPRRSYDYLHDICKLGKKHCLLNQIIGVQTSKLSPLEDYVILRTLWAPVDVCIESFEDNTATEYSVSIEMSTAYDWNKINIINNVFPIPRNIPEVDHRTDLKSLLEQIRTSQNFTVNDKTYLLVIARAIETQAQENEGTVTDTIIAERIMNLSQEENLNVTSGTFILPMLKASIQVAADSRHLADVVEAMLDLMLSDDDELSYTNINIYLVCLIRMLSIREYTIPILVKVMNLLEMIQDLHTTSWNPQNDDNIIRLKLEVLHALTDYFLGYRNENPNNNENSIYANTLIAVTYAFLEILPERQPMSHPSKRIFKSNNYEVTAFWLDPFMHLHNIITDLNDSVLTIDIDGLQSTLYSEFNMNRYINLAAHISDKAVLIAESMNEVPSAYMLHIILTKKLPTSQSFIVAAPGLYKIQYPIATKIINESTHFLKFDIYAAGSNKDIIYDSDCVFFRIEATTRYATIITITPNEKLILGLRIGFSNRLSVGLKTVDSDEILLPREVVRNNDCKASTPSPYSIFLPAVSMRQRSNMSGRIEYYIIISIKKNQTYKARRLDVGPTGLLDIGEAVMKLICVRLGCFRLEDYKLTNKDCVASSCSGNVSAVIHCNCDTGHTFTADAKPCYIRWFSINKAFRKHNVVVDEMELMIPTVITSLWFIFLIVVMKARRWDILERPLGKILLLEGVFSPFCSQHYLVCFVTGSFRNSGTKSIPFMTIIGSNNISPRYKLETMDYVFLRGSEIWLLVSVPDNLGRPRRVILSLEPDYAHFTHISPWFVKEVYIKNMTSGSEWTCPIHTWIPQHSKLDFPFVVKKVVKRPDNRKKVFGDILLRLLRNRHPVFGIFYNVPGTNFTKVQHAIVSFCGLLILMLICLKEHSPPAHELHDDHLKPYQFHLDVELVLTTVYSALLAVLPISFIGKFFENARHHYSPNVMWIHSIQKTAFQKQKNINMSYDGHGVENDSSGTEVDFYSAKSSKSPIGSLNYDTEFSSHRTFSTFLTSEYQEPSSICSLRHMISYCMTVIFSWPISLCLLLTIVGSVSISYYLFMLGLHINLPTSLEYLYVVCVSYAILMVVLYPLLLVVVAALHTLLYVYGKSYYGVRRETEYKVKSIYSALPGIVKLAHLYIFETRIRALGNKKDRILSRTKVARSYNWCKRLMKGRKVVKNGHIRHTTLETVLFTIVALLVINVEVGSVTRNFMQTQFVAQSLRLSTGMDDADNALTVDNVWDHILSMFSTLQSWRSESHMTSFLVLCAVQIRQIRAVPLEDDCHATEPAPLPRKCHEDIEHSQIETRSFANSWKLPIPRKIITSRPFTYEAGEHFSDTITSSHRYSGGGYYIHVPVTKKLPYDLTKLIDNNWLDENTKAVVISINLMNADSGLLTVVENVFEFKLAGIFMYTSNLYTFPLELTRTFEIVMSNLIIIFALLTAYFLIFEIRACFDMGFVTYFTHPQSWFLLVERCMSIAVLVIFFWLQNDQYNKVIQVHDAYFTETQDIEFINFDSVTHFKFFLILASSLLVGTCLMKTISLLKAYELMAKFVEMIPAMIAFLYIPAICIIGYALLGCMLFHTHLKYYNGFYAALYTVTLMLLDTAAIATTTEAFEYEGKLFSAALYCIMYYIILNYYITLLNEIYSEHKHQSRLEANKRPAASESLQTN